MKVLQKGDELILIPLEYPLNVRRLLWICDKNLVGVVSATEIELDRGADLEHMKSFKLDILAFVTEEIHHQLEIVFACYIARHHSKICAIQQYLAQKLQGLAFRYIVFRLDQTFVGCEELRKCPACVDKSK